MNKSNLKTYAPQARRDFIDMVTSRAAQLGIAEQNGELKVENSLVQGEVLVIAGQAFPVKIEMLRKRLLERIRQQGFSQTMEAIAYTWFNRFAALRYIELHDYLEHGQRVLSSVSAGGLPDILTHALDLAEAGELPAISRDMVAELKLSNKDGELYKRLLVAQCNKLATAMPFLFEKIDDDSELLLPDTLLRTDSVIRKLVDGIPEEDWQQVEVIGWLYQFYISEKKDQVIGKVVKSEDIPAATQLFTPNWIVKYLVQNSIGRLWLMANPHSGLAAQMEYYIQPAEQTPEVQAQLDALIRARCAEGVRGEGIGDIVEEIRNERDQELSGFNSVAKSDGLGGTGLSSNASISQGGVIRPYQSSTASSRVDSIQLGGGTRPQVESGVPEFCVDSTGITSGSRNADYDCPASKLHPSDSGTADATSTSGDWQNAQHPKNPPFREQGLGTKVQGLGTRVQGLGLSDSSTLPPTLYPLNPESITVLDPACGSGHILVEAYDLLKAIYLERGYKLREIPRLILKHNLFGLDIDDRAAQLAGFALLMKARADDRRLFENTPELNVLAIQDSKGVDDEVMAEAVMQAAIRLEGGEVLGNRDLFGGGALAAVHSSGLKAADVRELIRFFEFGKTFGSLLMVPEKLAGKLPKLEALLEGVVKSGDSLAKSYALQIQGDYLKPAGVLGKVYDAVVANPPYMGGKGMNEGLKDFAKKHFADSKSDLFAMFMERGFSWCKKFGFNSMVTMQSWMFLSSYEAMRTKLLETKTISSMAHLGARAFREISGEVVQTTAFVCLNESLAQFKPVFFRLIEGNDEVKQAALLNGKNRFDRVFQEDFKKIPSSPIAYWASEDLMRAFTLGQPLGEIAAPRQGLATSDNDRFLKLWHEVSNSKIAFNINNHEDASMSRSKWIPYNKGGEYRKWYGNNRFVINWENGGKELLSFAASLYGSPTRTIKNIPYYFQSSITWSALSSGGISLRYSPPGFIFDTKGQCIFKNNDRQSLFGFMGLLNSKVATSFMEVLAPTLDFNSGTVAKIPVAFDSLDQDHISIISNLVDLAKTDWDCSETSWDFQHHPILSSKYELSSNLSSDWGKLNDLCLSRIQVAQEFEEKNNKLFIDAYGLQQELSPAIRYDEVTFNHPDREKDMQRLISYAIGNMMGRYSLNETGLIYAHANNIGFDPTRYTTFPADADGILPVTDILWFADDAANRVREFLLAVWGGGKGVRDQGLGFRDQGLGIGEQGLTTIGQQGANYPLPPTPYPLSPTNALNENLLWLADSLGRKSEETPEEAIRRYIATSFYKDHLQTYKKRPIYWLFSSGKHKAFEALVYLHRYNEGTLSRMRTEYVVPLTGKMNDRIRFLETEVPKATSTAERKKLEKDIDRLKKKLDELRLYDEKLRHYADRRIALDLDDGVKVNYGKFGDLLAEVKAITGGSDE